MHDRSTLRRIVPWIMPLFGLAVFVAVVERAGPSRIVAVLAQADLHELVWAPVLVIAIAMARGLRWRFCS